MKKYALYLLLFFISNVGFTQATALKKNELGIDLLPLIIWAGGGDTEYDALEVIYREALPKGDLRFKLNVNKRNFFGKDIVKGKTLESTSPESFRSLQTSYEPSISYLFSVGLSRNSTNPKLPLYIGIDANFGMLRAMTNTYIKETFLTEENRLSIGRQSNNLILVGATPFLGFKKNLTDRLVFGIEFGVDLNYVTGDLKYYDEQETPLTERISQSDFSLKKIINDVTLMFRI